MSIILSASNQEVIDGTEHLCKLLLFPKLKLADVQAVNRHLHWMKTQKTNLNAQVGFETNPLTKTTKISFEISFNDL